MSIKVTDKMVNAGIQEFNRSKIETEQQVIETFRRIYRKMEQARINEDANRKAA